MTDGAAANEPAAKPTTTAEQDRFTSGQRRINLIWEVTQAAIALMIVGANVASAFVLVTTNSMLTNAFFLVVGFYFGRTNHARQGGVSQEPR
jgi:hypothetical protein